MEALTHQQALEEMLSYNYTLSVICVEKFRQLRLGRASVDWPVRIFDGPVVVRPERRHEIGSLPRSLGRDQGRQIVHDGPARRRPCRRVEDVVQRLDRACAEIVTES